MVPRADITAIDGNATARELLNRFTDANHSRLPVFRDTLDDPSGMVHVKDFLRWMTERSSPGRAAAAAENPEEEVSPGMVLRPEDLAVTVRQTGLVRPLLFVPLSMRAADLLGRCTITRIHMAIRGRRIWPGTDRSLVSIEDLRVEEDRRRHRRRARRSEAQLLRGRREGARGRRPTPIEDVELLVHRSLLPPAARRMPTRWAARFSMLGRALVRGELCAP